MADYFVSFSDYSKVAQWILNHGGSAVSARADALKVLEEVLELCYASGASALDIQNAVNEGAIKAKQRDEIQTWADFARARDEYGDVLVTLMSYAFKWNMIPDEILPVTFDKLRSRQWKANAVGILVRDR